ncbi:MAG: retron system putative HNH endonuclease [Ginsengibacter sp.]
MKYIIKTNPPKQYADWCKQVKGTQNENYGSLHSNERTPLKESLINEQGSLCAYTMKRIDMNTCHVEHIKPETVCRAEKRGSDLDYENMVACFPKGDLKPPYRYGAKEKDHWWEDEGKHFISPLSKRCETLLSFDLDGKVFAVNNNLDAVKTIGVIKLDHATLTEERRRSITEFIYGSEGISPLSKAKSLSAVEDLVKKNKNGIFIEFCIAIRGALLEHIKQLDKIAEKRKYAAHSRKK